MEKDREMWFVALGRADQTPLEYIYLTMLGSTDTDVACKIKASLFCLVRQLLPTPVVSVQYIFFE